MKFFEMIKEIEPKILEIIDLALKEAGKDLLPHANQLISTFQAMAQYKKPEEENK